LLVYVSIRSMLVKLATNRATNMYMDRINRYGPRFQDSSVQSIYSPRFLGYLA
jgi:hypothetical protein